MRAAFSRSGAGTTLAVVALALAVYVCSSLAVMRLTGDAVAGSAAGIGAGVKLLPLDTGPRPGRPIGAQDASAAITAADSARRIMLDFILTASSRYRSCCTES